MKIKSPYNKKLFGVLLLIFGVFGMLIIAHRLSYYVYEYDPQYSPVDYGKYNILSYFTVHSNLFGYVYLIASALAIFGCKKAQRFAYSPFVGALATTYIFIAGLVYCCGIPLGFTPPAKWDTAVHSFSSFIQVYYHMIMPPFMVLIWLFPATDEKIPLKKRGLQAFILSHIRFFPSSEASASPCTATLIRSTIHSSCGRRFSATSLLIISAHSG